MDVYKEAAYLDLFDGAAGGLNRHGHAEYIALYQLTMRTYLQNLGNEARDIFGDTFWIDQVLPNPAETTNRTPKFDCDFLCITDLRYPNEAERVKALGGTIWTIVRDGLESDGHASEQPLPADLVDHYISNNGSIEQLKWNVERTLEHMGC